MRIKYLFNSGFLIETAEFDILIDYVEGDFSPAPDKRLYILASHSHGDHYSRRIWDFNGENVVYLLSSDIKAEDAPNVCSIKKGDDFKDGGFYLQVCGSTDAGCSFLISTQGKKIFHAGDLNNWHWKNESTPEEIKEAEDYFKHELNYIAERCRHVNLAFFPVDPRLGKEYYLGPLQFIRKIKTDNFVPMHFGGDYMACNMFKIHAKKHAAYFVKINGPGYIGGGMKP